MATGVGGRTEKKKIRTQVFRVPVRARCPQAVCRPHGGCSVPTICALTAREVGMTGRRAPLVVTGMAVAPPSGAWEPQTGSPAAFQPPSTRTTWPAGAPDSPILRPPREATASTRPTRPTRRPTLLSTTTSATPRTTTRGGGSRKGSHGPRRTATRRATPASRTTALGPTAAAPRRAASSGPRPVGPQRPRTPQTPRVSRAPSTAPPAASPPAPGLL